MENEGLTKVTLLDGTERYTTYLGGVKSRCLQGRLRGPSGLVKVEDNRDCLLLK